MTRTLLALALTSLCTGTAIGSPREQSAAPPATDFSAQLLQEVRRLREAIELMVSTGARVQIVFGRLQLQEQRTASAARRLDDLHATLARITQESVDMTVRVQELEERMRDSRVSAEDRGNLEQELQAMKRVAAQHESERQRLQNEESMAAAGLASEQARWADLNQQLEELERALAKRP
jgi:predicted  nucleic acid-binding Zn-ribbon protein